MRWHSGCSGQIIAAIAAGLGPFSAGLGKGYSSPAIASLQQCDADAFQLTNQQASWLASLSLLGALFGAPLGGCAVRWGRRRTLIWSAPALSACWLMAAVASSVQAMWLAAFTSGCLVAIVQLAAQVYVSEIADAQIRGGLSGLLKVACQMGVVAAYTAGAYMDWRRLATLCAAVPTVMCLAMWWMPESPGWLMLQGDTVGAEHSLQWLRGPRNIDLHADELQLLRTHVLHHQHRQQLNIEKGERLVAFWSLVRGSACIAGGLMFFQRFSGVNAFYFYAVTVFRETFGATNPHSAAVAVAIVQLLSSLLSGLLVDSVGRLPLLLASSVLMSLALASFGSFAYYEQAISTSSALANTTAVVASNLDWIPLLCVLIFTIAFSLGISPISWLLVTELFPLEYRGAATAIVTSFSYLCSFVAVKTFVDFQQLFGLYGTFWLYSAVSVGGLWFFVCFVPETKGRDLNEINTAVIAAIPNKLHDNNFSSR